MYVACTDMMDQSASYSSTAASMPTAIGPASASSGRPTASPPSANPIQAQIRYSMAQNSLGPIGSAGQMPKSNLGQNVSWHQPAQSYATDTGPGPRSSWDFSGWQQNPGQSGLAPPSVQYNSQRIPSISYFSGIYDQRTTHA